MNPFPPRPVVHAALALALILSGCTSEPLLSRKGGVAAGELVVQSALALGRSNAQNPVGRNIEDNGTAYLGGVIPVKGQRHERARPVEKGTRLFVDGHLRGTIPLSANLAKPGPHILRIEVPGWQPHTLKLDPSMRLPVGVGEVESWPPIFVNCRTGDIFTAPKLASLDPYLAGAGANPNNTFRVGVEPILIVTTTTSAGRGWHKIGTMQRAPVAR